MSGTLATLGIVGKIATIATATDGKGEMSPTKSTVIVSVVDGDSLACHIQIDADVAESEFITAIQRDPIGIADSVTLDRPADLTADAH